MFRKEVKMSINKLYLGFLLALCVAITGCDGDVESMGDITVNVEGDDNSIDLRERSIPCSKEFLVDVNLDDAIITVAWDPSF